MRANANPNPWLPWIAPIVGALLNVALNAANRTLGSPFFFDSVLTATVAALWGLMPGLVTALLTQAGMEVFLWFAGAPGTALPFVWCGFATAVIVWAFAASGQFEKPHSLLWTALAVTMANSVVGSIIAVFVFRGLTRHASDYLMTGFLLAGQGLFESAFWSRIPVNLVDKGIAVGLAFLALRAHRRANPASQRFSQDS